MGSRIGLILWQEARNKRGKEHDENFTTWLFSLSMSGIFEHECINRENKAFHGSRKRISTMILAYSLTELCLQSLT